MLSQDDVFNNFMYDPDNGVMQRVDGKICNTLNNGYYRTNIGNKSYYVHQLAWLFVYGYMPKVIDHINMNKTDNRIFNLRNVNHHTNMKNKTLETRNKSGVNGVFQDFCGKFKASIGVNGKTVHIGMFASKVMAYEARLDANIKYGFTKGHGHER